MESDKKEIFVYCGFDIKVLSVQQHPVDEVKKALQMLRDFQKKGANLHISSNSCDFVFAIKWLGLQLGIEVQFFLDGVSHGNDIEPIFASFNKAYDLVETLCDSLSKENFVESDCKIPIVPLVHITDESHHKYYHYVEEHIRNNTPTTFTTYQEKLFNHFSGDLSELGIQFDKTIQIPTLSVRFADENQTNTSAEKVFDKPKSKYHK